MKTIFLFFVLLSLIQPVSAHCPLCTGAIAMVAGGAKILGFNSAIIGVFVGGFALSTGLWFSKKFNPKYKSLVVLASIILTIGPLAFMDEGQVLVPLLLFGEEGTFFNTLHSFNSLLVGGVVGVIVSWIAFRAHDLVKQKRGKVFFPYQSIAFAVSALIITSAALQIILGG